MKVILVNKSNKNLLHKQDILYFKNGVFVCNEKEVFNLFEIDAIEGLKLQVVKKYTEEKINLKGLRHEIYQHCLTNRSDVFDKFNFLKKEICISSLIDFVFIYNLNLFETVFFISNKKNAVDDFKKFNFEVDIIDKREVFFDINEFEFLVLKNDFEKKVFLQKNYFDVSTKQDFVLNNEKISLIFAIYKLCFSFLLYEKKSAFIDLLIFAKEEQSVIELIHKNNRYSFFEIKTSLSFIKEDFESKNFVSVAIKLLDFFGIKSLICEHINNNIKLLNFNQIERILNFFYIKKVDKYLFGKSYNSILVDDFDNSRYNNFAVHFDDIKNIKDDDFDLLYCYTFFCNNKPLIVEFEDKNDSQNKLSFLFDDIKKQLECDYIDFYQNNNQIKHKISNDHAFSPTGLNLLIKNPAYFYLKNMLFIKNETSFDLVNEIFLKGNIVDSFVECIIKNKTEEISLLQNKLQYLDYFDEKNLKILFEKIENYINSIRDKGQELDSKIRLCGDFLNFKLHGEVDFLILDKNLKHLSFCDVKTSSLYYFSLASTLKDVQLPFYYYLLKNNPDFKDYNILDYFYLVCSISDKSVKVSGNESGKVDLEKVNSTFVENFENLINYYTKEEAIFDYNYFAESRRVNDYYELILRYKNFFE